jgi:hypothetical protein
MTILSYSIGNNNKVAVKDLYLQLIPDSFLNHHQCRAENEVSSSVMMEEAGPTVIENEFHNLPGVGQGTRLGWHGQSSQ